MLCAVTSCQCGDGSCVAARLRLRHRDGRLDRVIVRLGARYPVLHNLRVCGGRKQAHVSQLRAPILPSGRVTRAPDRNDAAMTRFCDRRRSAARGLECLRRARNPKAAGHCTSPVDVLAVRRLLTVGAVHDRVAVLVHVALGLGEHCTRTAPTCAHGHSWPRGTPRPPAVLAPVRRDTRAPPPGRGDWTPKRAPSRPLTTHARCWCWHQCGAPLDSS